MLRSLFLAFCLIVPLSACGPVESESSESQSSTVTVTGQAAYRERIALRPGLTFTVTLEDISIADRKAPVLETVIRALGTEQVPLPFELTVDRADLSERGRYSVRAKITDADGALQWTTDTAHLVTSTPATQSLGTLNLVRVQNSGARPLLEPADYDCAGTLAKLTFQPNKAVMVFDGDRYPLAQTPAASGAKYTAIAGAPAAMFWDKGDTALVQIGDGEVVECNKVKAL